MKNEKTTEQFSFIPNIFDFHEFQQLHYHLVIVFSLLDCSEVFAYFSVSFLMVRENQRKRKKNGKQKIM